VDWEQDAPGTGRLEALPYSHPRRANNFGMLAPPETKRHLDACIFRSLTNDF
jgi:hypothetical protein